MINEQVTLYCDESGYTGNNLLDKNQKIFTYAVVKTEEDEAKKIIQSSAQKYNICITNNEVKSSNLLTMKNDNGRQMIDEILDYYCNSFKVFIANKKYALAGKFFEYTFEPCLSQSNSILYRLNFHRMLSTLMYTSFVSRSDSVEEIFIDFYCFISDKSDSFILNYETEPGTPVHGVCEFMSIHKEIILEEINSLKGNGSNKFILDLSFTALFGLLAYWGETHSGFNVFCDSSKPIASQKTILDNMIGKKDKVYSHFGFKETPITFNLNSPVQLVDSKLNFGIQVADIISGAIAYAFNTDKEDNKFKIKWRGMLNQTNAPIVLFPEKQFLDITKHSVQLNTVLFHEIIRRSKNNLDLNTNLHSFVRCASEELKSRPLL